MSLTIGSLFSGIGGLELGLERAGLGPVIFQAESDPYCLKVLEKHWPGVRRYTDVKQIDESTKKTDLICGGFPCQDVSAAGGREGIEGKRSGLWSEFARCIRVLRPRIVLVENVSGLLDRGMGRVQGDLAACGYDSEWHSIPTGVQFGHRRNRVFIVAYAYGARLESSRGHREAAGATKGKPVLSTASCVYRVQSAPRFVRAIHGIPNRIHRIRALGNAVVPQVSQLIGEMILSSTGDL